ncbi:MAG: RNA pyrophosphohydrolase [Holosporales bacterium]|jgi:putative (di)nucleoside polyphosphate hydrolase|nr:RNA pyrophosphohydrolase [Holosporales bacterium]
MNSKSLELYEKKGYRPCVGMIVVNQEGKIFVGERTDVKGAWQMPQGGISSGEMPLKAAYRELHEETGMAQRDLILKAQAKRVYIYDFPSKTAHRTFGGKYKGQVQQWFLFRFAGNDSSVNIAQSEQEFSAWKWEAPNIVLGLAVDFKTDVYREVFCDFCIKVS